MFTIVAFLIVCIINSTLSENSFVPFIRETTPPAGDKLNVVLFFADSDTKCNYEKDDGISYLNIPLITRIQPCTPRPTSELPRSIIQYSRRSRECDCKKLLESGILSLVSWANNVAGMTTAMVSLNNIGKVEIRNTERDYSDSISKPSANEPPSLSAETQQNSKKANIKPPQPYMGKFRKARFERLPLPLDPSINTNDLPKLQLQDNPLEQDISIINAFPHEPKLEFNDIHRYRDKVHPKDDKDAANVRRDKRQYVVEPENTQVFEINDDSKINEDEAKNLETRSLDNFDKPDTIWDVLGIMSVIRESFFSNLLKPLPDPQQRISDEENGLNFRSLGQVQEPTLFQIVKGMLRKVQDQTKENDEATGYLLVVFGGNLKDLSDPYSGLSQSIKHVMETTDSKRILTAVTGSCPKDHRDEMPRELQFSQARSSEKVLLPVYAKGPSCSMLSKAQELFDIPKQLKAVIKKHVYKETVTARPYNEILKAHLQNNNIPKPKNKQNREMVLDSNIIPKEGLWVSSNVQGSISGRFVKQAESGSVKLILNIFSIFVPVLTYVL